MTQIYTLVLVLGSKGEGRLELRQMVGKAEDLCQSRAARQRRFSIKSHRHGVCLHIPLTQMLKAFMCIFLGSLPISLNVSLAYSKKEWYLPRREWGWVERGGQNEEETQEYAQKISSCLSTLCWRTTRKVHALMLKLGMPKSSCPWSEAEKKVVIQSLTTSWWLHRASGRHGTCSSPEIPLCGMRSFTLVRAYWEQPADKPDSKCLFFLQDWL